MKSNHDIFNKRPFVALCVRAIALSVASTTTVTAVHAQSDRILEEVTVTARKVEEGLQDIPVTAQAIGGDALQQFALDDPAQLVNFIPNFTIAKGGSGAGASIRLRGVGASSLSAAFDTAVAVNIDGVQTNNARFLFTSMFDVEQVEVLKGPQSLYFGKSATAGVVSLVSKNPGDEFEAGATASWEFEQDGTRVEAFASGPLTDTFGARLAVRWLEVDKLMKNTSGQSNIGGFIAGPPPSYLGPSGVTPHNRWRGEESIDARLTLDWQPTDNFGANFKYVRSDYENDGQFYMMDVVCRGSTSQPDAFFLLPPPAAPFIRPTDLDCDPFDHEIQNNDIPFAGAPDVNDGVPFSEVELDMVSLTLDWEIDDHWSLRSITGYLDLDNRSAENFSFTNNHGAASPLTISARENFSQEFVIRSDFGGFFDVNGGVYYQRRENVFDSWQFAFLTSFLAGPDLVTGNATDWRKVHNTDIDAYSAYVNFTLRPTESLTVNVGGRYSDEKHDGEMRVPYMHAALAGGGFPSSGTVIDGIEFEDDEFNPEIAAIWAVTDEVNLFASYKTGFKSGGIDNSVLPSPGLTLDTLEGLAVFESETVDGFEFGLKSELLDGSLRANVTTFHYVYEDLQTQTIDQSGGVFNFETLNAGEVTSQGVELELLWAAYSGLTLGSALAYTDSEYTDDFFVLGPPAIGLENLDGSQVEGSSYWAGNLMLDYVAAVSDTLEMNFGVLANYRTGYQAGLWSSSYQQGSFWNVDSSVSIGSQDGRWELALIGRNLGDEISVPAQTSAIRAHALPDAAGFADQYVQLSHPRQVFLQATVNL